MIYLFSGEAWCGAIKDATTDAAAALGEPLAGRSIDSALSIEFI
tara:strand:- start:39 stop:170 length:132 start_codon:yes stop_codon:yes gene_type:complete